MVVDTFSWIKTSILEVVANFAGYSSNYRGDRHLNTAKAQVNKNMFDCRSMPFLRILDVRPMMGRFRMSGRPVKAISISCPGPVKILSSIRRVSTFSGSMSSSSIVTSSTRGRTSFSRFCGTNTKLSSLWIASFLRSRETIRGLFFPIPCGTSQFFVQTHAATPWRKPGLAIHLPYAR